MCMPASHYSPSPRCSFGSPKLLLDTLTPTGPIPVSVKLSRRPDPWLAFLTADPDTIHGWRLDSETPFYRRVTSLGRLYDGHVKIRSVTPFVPVCPHYKP